MRLNNKGFSYVELVLVMAIMAIMVSIMTLSIGLVNRTNINRGSEKIGSALSQARNTSMARGANRGAIEISFDGDQYYIYIGDVNSPDKEQLKEELVSSPAKIGYYIEGNSELQEISTSASLILKYNQSTGAFQPLASGDYCDSIVLYNGEKSATIELHSQTGKSELVY